MPAKKREKTRPIAIRISEILHKIAQGSDRIISCMEDEPDKFKIFITSTNVHFSKLVHISRLADRVCITCDNHTTLSGHDDDDLFHPVDLSNALHYIRERAEIIGHEIDVRDAEGLDFEVPETIWELPIMCMRALHIWKATDIGLRLSMIVVKDD